MTTATLPHGTSDPVRTTHFDVIVVGAGLSGIAAAYYLKTRTPKKTFAILEGRETIGGTWDLFKYPGVRSDSDMHTLGYGFNPWPSDQSITGAPLILEYIRSTAKRHEIEQKIKFGHRVVHAAWSSAQQLWRIDARVGPEGTPVKFTANFLFMCSGYYDYSGGYEPQWAGREDFKGRFVHPQHWPADLDYAGKRVVIIGSGATAVTLAPAMTDLASHVTMLQRSPTYIIARPSTDPISVWARKRLPERLAGTFVRWKNVLLGMFFFQMSKKRPDRIKKLIRDGVLAHLGPDYDVDTHFKPAYNPWDQRVCLVPDGDFFKAIRDGKIDVATDHIDRFTENGITLKSGRTLQADIVVSATGLRIQLMGGMTVDVDGERVDFGKRLNYKGMMYSDVPNLASAFGYTNASWTLKCELTAQYVTRLLNYMDAKGFGACVPRMRDEKMAKIPALDFSSGYVQRAEGVLPKQGARAPWRLYQNYALDLASLKFGKLEDGSMEFVKAKVAARV